MHVCVGVWVWTLAGVAAVTGLNLAAVLFVLCAGFPFADAANFTPFAPYGLRGVFSAASMVFFSFVGFDMIASCAEEVRGARCPSSVVLFRQSMQFCCVSWRARDIHSCVL